MVRRWLDNFGLGRTKKLLEFNNTRPEIFLRRSSRRITRQQFEADSRELCVSSGGFMNLYYRLTQPIPPEKIALLREGYCTVQAPSSGWVVAMLKPERNQRLLDVCSAPGGKTSLLAELAGESGAVCACEIRMYRLRRMIDTIGRLQLHNVYPVLCNGINLPFAGSFDSVLLDAPCSGTGVLHRHPDGRWIKTPEHIERIVSAQQRLLDGAAPFVVPGGVLVYATCSLEPEENHRQISSFLQRQPDFELESPPAAVPQKFIDNEGCLFVTPFEHGMDGMFAARLRKHT
jgi:16S rRNA (cytosine967-C5)-methyltransferase